MTAAAGGDVETRIEAEPESATSTTRKIELGARPRILVIALRRLGDVLLTTPLVRSLRRAWPDATLDVLVFADTAAILAGNPDVDHVITMPSRPTFRQGVSLAAQVFKHYHLAVSTQSGDRPTLFALLAGRRHVGPVDAGPRGAVRRLLLGRSVGPADGLHRVVETLRLADLLGIARHDAIICPAVAKPARAPPGPYAVIHAVPMFRYKQWTLEGWRALARSLAARGLTVVASGGPSADEKRYLDSLWSDMCAVARSDGQLCWGELSALLAGARVYIGPDTSVTHLAAASGCPTVALYGPTDPRRWGPWPASGLVQPWDAASEIQQRGNVFLVQNPLTCLPCQAEGCERRLDSYSRCLDELPVARVEAAIDRALATRGHGAAAQTRL